MSTPENQNQNTDPNADPNAGAPAGGGAEGADLGPGGQAALKAERDARKNAEKAAREAQAKLDAIEREKESETDRLKREAEDGKKRYAEATTRLRQATTLTALASEGLIGPTALAAMKLIDGVEYDDTTDQPQNLKERLDAAKATYGAQMFAGATPGEPAGGANGGTPANGVQPVRPGLEPDPHQGPRRDAPGTDDAAQMDAYMKQHFPQLAQAGGGFTA